LVFLTKLFLYLSARKI